METFSYQQLPCPEKSEQIVDHSLELKVPELSQETRYSLTKLLKQSGDALMLASALVFITGMLGICSMNAVFEWLKEQLKKPEESAKID